MKRILCIALCVIVALSLCACGYNKKGRDERHTNDGRVSVVYNDGYCVIYRDNETGVQYLNRARAGTCVMVNPDGTPYIGGADHED